MELEDQAKQTAELLFFVIDNQTRSTASMVEAAYLAGAYVRCSAGAAAFQHCRV